MLGDTRDLPGACCVSTVLSAARVLTHVMMLRGRCEGAVVMSSLSDNENEAQGGVK